MDPKSSSPHVLLAPPHGDYTGTVRMPSSREAPRVDERLVRPETRQQLLRSRPIEAMPANPEHADRHFELDYVIRAHVRTGYVGATDLLTRSAAQSDFATDTCVRREGIDPDTKARYLEELAFEVVNEQSLRDVTEQAQDLTARGVRRIVSIFVKRGEVCEWSPETTAWKALDPEGTFTDPTLARPLRVKELLGAAAADDAVARALLAKNNPVLAEALAEAQTESRHEGHRQGLRQGIEVACELLGIPLTTERRAQMLALDGAGLETLLADLRAERRWR